MPHPECNATYQFTCKNKFCKPLFWVCDNVNDCGDNSDELECGECSWGYGLGCSQLSAEASSPC